MKIRETQQKSLIVLLLHKLLFLSLLFFVDSKNIAQLKNNWTSCHFLPLQLRRGVDLRLLQSTPCVCNSRNDHNNIPAATVQHVVASLVASLFSCLALGCTASKEKSTSGPDVHPNCFGVCVCVCVCTLFTFGRAREIWKRKRNEMPPPPFHWL